MIKGRTTIQIIDEKSGETLREIHEENMITNAVDTILNPPDYIETGMDAENDRSYNPLRDFLGNLADTAFRGVIVCRDKIPEDGNNMMLPWTNEEIGHAGIANTNTDAFIGTYNENESGVIENGKGYRHVWDFASDKANGEIGCICLTTKDGGTCGMHNAYWEMSMGGTDLNSNSTGSFRSTYHPIVGRHVPDSELHNGRMKWFYMDRLENGYVRMLGKHIYDCGIYEVVMFNPMSISISNEKPFCGIISVKRVIELFPAPNIIPEAKYKDEYFHSVDFYDSDYTNKDYLPADEKERLINSWYSNPQWMPFFPYVKGEEIHIVATSPQQIHHYIYNLSDYSLIIKKSIVTDVSPQEYNLYLDYVTTTKTSAKYRWFYGTNKNYEQNSVLSAFEWDDKYFVITKYPVIDGNEVTTTANYGQMRVFTKDGKCTGQVFQYINDGRLSNLGAASFWGFYIDEKTNTPLLITDTCNVSNSLVAVEIIKLGDDYKWYRMRLSAPNYGSNYMGVYANIMKIPGVTLPLYVVPYYPNTSGDKHFFGFVLGIVKTCLTTINNLSEPVRKLDGQVMKITYDIVDE